MSNTGDNNHDIDNFNEETKGNSPNKLHNDYNNTMSKKHNACNKSIHYCDMPDYSQEGTSIQLFSPILRPGSMHK